jgi:hypothetical protein
VPIIVVSGNAQDALEARRFTEDVTDYFDKGLGYSALAAFIRGYVQPEPIPGARVLYVEDSKVVAMATKRMLERNGLAVVHFVGVEEALEIPRAASRQRRSGRDLVLTDVYLKGKLGRQRPAASRPQRLRLRQAPHAGAGDDRRRQSRQPERTAAHGRQRPGAQADRGAAAGDQDPVPAARGAGCRSSAAAMPERRGTAVILCA